MSNSSIENPSVENAVSATERFLEPALRDRDSITSITRKIATAKADAAFTSEEGHRILKEACHLLNAIHGAVKFEKNHRGDQPYDSRLLGAVYNLLDLLVLEGIYPALVDGVGNPIERRTKSLLYRCPDPSYKPSQNVGDIQAVLAQSLDPITDDFDDGIEPLMRHRVLSDLIAAHAWLAHAHGFYFFPSGFARYLDRLPIPTLYLALTGLIKPNAPEWFRSILTEYLSKLPLRKNGVRHTIEFIASQYPAAQSATEKGGLKPSQGPSLPIEALQQASKLLSSVPKSMSLEDYFSQLVPQLLDLLDKKEEKELGRAAGFVISSGILSKRSLGAPGTIGWTLCAEPIMRTLNPQPVSITRKRKANSDGDTLGRQLVGQATLALALRRLSILIASYPNPALTGRLLSPLLLPLWGLINCDKPPIASLEWSELPYKLIETFLKLSGNPKHIQTISESLLWDGTVEWTFGPGNEGGVAIVERAKKSDLDLNIIERISAVDLRVNNFTRLLSSGSVDDSTISSLIFDLFQKSLSSQPRDEPKQLHVDNDPVQNLAQAKLTKAVLEQFQDRLSQSNDQVLMLIQQTLQQQLHVAGKGVRRRQDLLTPSYSSLGNIVPQGHNENSDSVGFEGQATSGDTLAVAISLLNAILMNFDSKPDEKIVGVLKTITGLLGEVSKLPDTTFGASLKTSVQFAMSLVKKAVMGQPPSNTDALPQTAAQDASQTLNLIIADLATDLPPVRNSALHVLETLIKAPNTPLDIPVVTILLINTIRTDPEEFVFLAAIRTLSQLATIRDLQLVTKLTVDAFQDAQEETGIDGRLRLGEALTSLINALADGIGFSFSFSSSTSGPVVCRIAEVSTAVAGRRGMRRREDQERKRKEKLEKRRKREAERAWGGEIPELPMEFEEDIDLAEQEKRYEEIEAIEKVVKGWEGTGFEEDVRIRASALSVLGLALERFLDSLSPTIIDSAVDLSLSIVSLERSPEKAILRRGAILNLLSALRAIDDAEDAGRDVAISVTVEKWMDVEKVLGWVRDTEDDDLTKGHAEAVLEGLDAWRMKKILRARPDGSQGSSLGLELESRLRGLAVDPGAPLRSDTRNPKIEEID